MHSIFPQEDSFTNAGEDGSHAVYPLASKVALRPPDGNDDEDHSLHAVPAAGFSFMGLGCFHVSLSFSLSRQTVIVAALSVNHSASLCKKKEYSY